MGSFHDLSSIRYRFAAVALGLLAAGVGLAPIAQASPSASPFVGDWTSIDVDGSDQILTVSGGSAVHLTYTDFGAPGTCSGAPVAIFSSTLSGSAADSVLSATIDSAHCGPKSVDDLVGYPLDFTYDASTDTLFGVGVTWYRSGST